MLCPLDLLARSSMIQRQRERADLTSSVTVPRAAFHEDPCSPARCVPTTPPDIHYEYPPRPGRERLGYWTWTWQGGPGTARPGSLVVFCASDQSAEGPRTWEPSEARL